MSAVEVSVAIGPNRGVIYTERDPSFVDFKVFGMKHATTVPVTQNDQAQWQRRASAPLAYARGVTHLVFVVCSALFDGIYDPCRWLLFRQKRLSLLLG